MATGSELGAPLGFGLGDTTATASVVTGSGITSAQPGLLAAVDTRCTNDLPLHDVQIAGIELIANAHYRRLTTPQGGLQFVGEDASYGFAVQNLINDNLTAASASGYSAIIRSQLLRDPRVSDAQVAVSFNQSQLTIAITETLAPTGQTFKWLLGVDGLSGSTFFQIQ